MTAEVSASDKRNAPCGIGWKCVNPTPFRSKKTKLVAGFKNNRVAGATF